MNNKLLGNMIRVREGELQELRKVEAYLEEVEKLNRVKVFINAETMNTTMYYKDTKVTLSGDEKKIAEYVIDYFQQATNGVDVYISNYGEVGTVGALIGGIIALDKNFLVYKMREVICHGL